MAEAWFHGILRRCGNDFEKRTSWDGRSLVLLLLCRLSRASHFAHCHHFLQNNHQDLRGSEMKIIGKRRRRSQRKKKHRFPAERPRFLRHNKDVINKTWPQILISWHQFKTWPQNLISWHQFKTWPQKLIKWYQFKDGLKNQ